MTGIRIKNIETTVALDNLHAISMLIYSAYRGCFTVTENYPVAVLAPVIVLTHSNVCTNHRRRISMNVSE